MATQSASEIAALRAELEAIHEAQSRPREEFVPKPKPKRNASASHAEIELEGLGGRDRAMRAPSAQTFSLTSPPTAAEDDEDDEHNLLDSNSKDLDFFAGLSAGSAVGSSSRTGTNGTSTSESRRASVTPPVAPVVESGADDADSMNLAWDVGFLELPAKACLQKDKYATEVRELSLEKKR